MCVCVCVRARARACLQTWIKLCIDVVCVSFDVLNNFWDLKEYTEACKCSFEATLDDLVWNTPQKTELEILGL